MLGTVEAHAADGPVDLGHARQKATLAILLAEAGRVVHADRLIDRLWADAAPRSAKETLYGYLSRLRSSLSTGGVTIGRAGGGYLLDIDPLSVDMHLFTDLAARADAADEPAAAARLRQHALQLWRGQPFADVDLPWLDGLARQLEAKRFAVDRDLCDALLAQGEHARLLPDLTAAAETHPLDQRIAGQLLLALFQSGRQSEALAHYDRLRRRLSEELGCDPEPKLRQLHRSILGADSHSAGRSERALGEFAELPAGPTDFTGRRRELAQLDEYAHAQSEVVTLTGAGGVGKTALAVHWARFGRVRDTFSDGRLYVDLRGFSGDTPLTCYGAVSRLLQQLRVPAEQIPAELEQALLVYRRRLASRRILIILDNAADASQVGPLLSPAPGCLALITSRQQLTGLEVRDRAKRLPLERLPAADAGDLGARLLDADTTSGAPVARLVEVCARLPLAIRLAAAGFRSAHPDTALRDYVDELDTDRLGLLDVIGDETSSISAILSWSTRRLPEEVSRAFALMGVHPGPDMDLAAAGALWETDTPSARRTLKQLLGANLVEEPTPGRFALHDLAREYACQQADRFCDHAQTYSRIMRHYTQRLNRLGDDPSDVETFQTEHPVLTACMDLPVTDELGEYAGLLAGRLFDFGYLADAVSAHLLAVRHLDKGTIAHARSELGLGAAESATGRWDSATARLTEALEDLRRLNASPEQGMALRELAELARGRGDHQHASDLTLEALALFQAHGERAWESEALVALSRSALTAGEFHTALEQGRRALDIAQSVADVRKEADALKVLGSVSRSIGDLDAAVSQYETALEIMRHTGRPHQLSHLLVKLGLARDDLGELSAASECYREALEIAVKIGNQESQPHIFHGMGNLDLKAKRPQAAQEHYLRAFQLCRELGDRAGEGYTGFAVANALRDQGEHRQARQWYLSAVAQLAELEIPHGEALAQLGLGRCLAAAGDMDDAAQALRRAKEIFHGLGAPEADEAQAALDALTA